MAVSVGLVVLPLLHRRLARATIQSKREDQGEGDDRSAVQASASGKVLLTGGYLILDQAYSGIVLAVEARSFCFLVACRHAPCTWLRLGAVAVGAVPHGGYPTVRRRLE